MKMKSRVISLFVGAACMVTTAVASASSWSSSFTITQLWTWGLGYHVAGAGSFANPAGCQYSLYAFEDSSLPQDRKDEIGRTLTSAFLAGKHVQLLIDGTAGKCDTGYPVFYAVTVTN